MSTVEEFITSLSEELLDLCTKERFLKSLNIMILMSAVICLKNDKKLF